MEKRLVCSYDDINDTFVGKVSDEKGFYADYGICNGIYVGVNNSNYPTLIHVSHASKVFNAPKQILKNNNIEILLDCSDSALLFKMFIDGLEIFSTSCKNNFGIPALHYSINSNF